MHRWTYYNYRLFAKGMAAQERSLALQRDYMRRRYPGLLTPDGRLDSDNAATFLGVSKKTLANWRNRRIGPRWRKVGSMVSSGKACAGLPAKPPIEDGRAKKDVNGRLAYTTILRWRDHDIGDRFSAAVVGLVPARHPEIFADGRSP